MRILVTGASVYIVGKMVGALLAKGWETGYQFKYDTRTAFMEFVKAAKS